MASNRGCIARRAAPDRGAQAVEFALIVPAVLVLLTGLVEITATPKPPVRR